MAADASGAHALEALREALVGSRAIVEDGVNLVIGGKPFPKLLPMPLVSKITVTLGGLWLLSKHPTMPVAQLRPLVKKHAAGKLPLITKRKAILGYLMGRASGEGVVNPEVLSGSAAGTTAAAAAGGVSGASQAAGHAAIDMPGTAPPPLGWAPLTAIMANELPVRTRESTVCVETDIYTRLKGVLAEVAAADGAGSEDEGEVRGTKRARSGAGSTGPGGKKARSFYATPIIVVPSLSTALLNLHNAKAFLEEGRYITPQAAQEEALAAGGDGLKPEVLRVVRVDSRGVKCSYKVVDNAASLSRNDWLRVAAVFALGPKWQFTGWKWGKPERADLPPPEIFRRCLGCHLHFKDTPLHANIPKWPLRLLPIDQVKRHLDPVASAAFWGKLDEFLSAKKPELLAPPGKA